MKISVIIACLNARNTIEDTFLSILNQTYKNIELVVIDGASKDETIEIINKYKDKISYFISEPDDGVYDAMNKGIKAAKGDFIVFLNANDVFYDNFVVEKVAKTLIENPEAKFLFGDVDYLSQDSQSSNVLKFDNIKNDFSLAFNNICHQSIFYHKSLFERFGFYSEEFKIYSDWDFNIKCLVKNKVSAIYLPIVISKFQLGGICSDSANAKTCKLEKVALIKKYYADFSFIILSNEFLRTKLGIIYKILINGLFIRKIANLFSCQDKYKLNIKTYSPINVMVEA